MALGNLDPRVFFTVILTLLTTQKKKNFIFVVNTRCFVVNTRSFVVNTRSFVGPSAQYSYTKPEKLQKIQQTASLWHAEYPLQLQTVVDNKP